MAVRSWSDAVRKALAEQRIGDITEAGLDGASVNRQR